jgi:hypothetical protein
LAEILSEKIDQGFTFPLNPKWILCDANRWKQLYDKLLRSDTEETQQSMNIWFPPDSGLREQIERIHQSRPEGFYEEPPESEFEFEVSIGSGTRSESQKESKTTHRRAALKGAPQDHLFSMFAMEIMEKNQQNDDSSFDADQMTDLSDSSKRTAIVRGAKKVTKVIVKNKVTNALLKNRAVGGLKNKLSGKSPENERDHADDGESIIADSKKAGTEDVKENASATSTSGKRQSKKGKKEEDLLNKRMASAVERELMEKVKKKNKKQLAKALEKELKEYEKAKAKKVKYTVLDD